MKHALLIAALFVASAAHAGGNSNNSDITNNYDQRNYGGNTTNQGGQGGTGIGGQGGAGGTGIGVGIGQGGEGGKANSSSASNANAGAAAGATSGSISAATGGKASASSGGNTMRGGDITIGGDNYEAAASSVFAAPIPTVATSCRLYMFGGATGRDGAASGSIPLGNDQTCLSGVNMNNMLRVNEQSLKLTKSTVFSIDDLVTEACKVEGMETAAPCKK